MIEMEKQLNKTECKNCGKQFGAIHKKRYCSAACLKKGKIKIASDWQERNRDRVNANKRAWRDTPVGIENTKRDNAKPQAKAAQAEWRKNNRERGRLATARYRARHPERRAIELEQKRIYTRAHPEKTRVWQRTRMVKLKREIISHYGGKCVGWDQKGCKFNADDIRVLSIDHKEGGGGQHRKSINNKNFYYWIKRNNYPDSLQCLCMNCQWIKKYENKEFGNYKG